MERLDSCAAVGVSSCDGWVDGESPEGYGARRNAHKNSNSILHSSHIEFDLGSGHLRIVQGRRGS